MQGGMFDAQLFRQAFCSWEQLGRVPLAVRCQRVRQVFRIQFELLKAVVQVFEHRGEGLKSKLLIGKQLPRTPSPHQQVASPRTGWVTPTDPMPRDKGFVGSFTTTLPDEPRDDLGRKAFGSPHEFPLEAGADRHRKNFRQQGN